jgi:transposase
MVTITNTSYINAWCVVDLLRELRKLHIDGPITLVLDNAKYQRCYVAERAAHMLNIELLYLPSYSPNLNLIERAWKFIRKKALNNRSFKSFQLFQEAISECIEKFPSDYKKELATLLTWNFQSF